MALLFYFVVILMNIFTGVYYGKKDKKKANTLILFISFIIIFLLMDGYRNTSGYTNDLLYNQIEFNNIISGLGSSYEFGYVLLNKIGGIFTEDFYAFRSGINGIFLLILFWSIKKWAPSPHYVISLFSAYLLVLSSIQLRYFLAFVIFQVGICFLLYSNNKYKKIIYSCFLLLASTIHFSFLLYFVFLLSSILRKSKKEKILACLTILLCIVIFINNNQIPYLSQLLKFTDSDKIYIYMSQSTHLGFLYIIVLHISSLILTLWALKLSVKSNNNKTISIIERVYKLDLLATIFFPLYMLQTTFYRLTRSMLVINYCVYSQIIISKEVNVNKKRLFVFLVWLSVIAWIVVDLVLKTSAQGLLIPFFKENIYLNF